MNEKLKKEYILLSAFFALYMFEYMMTSTMLNQSATGVVSSAMQLKLYYMDMVFCVLGYAAFAAGRWITQNPKVHKAVMGAAAVLYASGIILLFYFRTADSYRFIAPVTMFCLGIMGGMAYYCMSGSLADSGYLGRVMGAGGAAAILLQFVLGLLTDIPAANLVTLLAGLAVMGWLFYKLQRDWQMPDAPEDLRQESGQKSSLRISLAGAVVITISLLMLCQYFDSRMVTMAVQSDFELINPYTWPRLCMVVTYLLMGALGDLKDGKYVPLFTLCSMLVSVLTPILLGDADKSLFCLCLFYINVGVTISYYNLVFCRLAPRTGWPQLWAGMGRILDGLTSIAVYVLHISALSAPVIIGIDIVLLIGMIVAMVVGGDFALSSASQRQEEAQRIEEIKEVKDIKNSSADTFEALCVQFSLTERETEVLQKLLFTEDDLQTIADSLSISRRVLSRHITAIYQKTGAKSRVGLYQIYHDACLNI